MVVNTIIMIKVGGLTLEVLGAGGFIDASDRPAVRLFF